VLLLSSVLLEVKMSREFLRVVSVAAAVLSVVMAAGCTSSGTSTTGSTSLTPVAGLEKTNLTVGAVPVADEAGLYIAQDEGLFAAEGLHVTIDPILSSADATKGQNDGKFDITAGNAVSYVQDQVAHRSDLEIVAEGSLMQRTIRRCIPCPGRPLRPSPTSRGAGSASTC